MIGKTAWLALAAFGTQAQPLPAGDPRADDAVAAFTAFCTDTNAEPAAARAAFDGHPEIARKLDAQTLGVFLGANAAAKVSEGWITHSAHDAWYVVAYAPSLRSCEVLVKEADATALLARTRIAVQTLGATRRAQVTRSTERRIDVDGTPATELTWIMATAATDRVSVLASVADRPFGAKQALLTFAVLHAATLPKTD